MDQNDYYLFGILDEYINSLNGNSKFDKESVKAILNYKANRNDSIMNALIQIGLRTVSDEFEKWGGIDA